jgi:hypothetical protein
MKDVARTDAITLLRLLNDSKVALVAAKLKRHAFGGLPEMGHGHGQQGTVRNGPI